MFASVEAATRKPAGTIRFAAFLFILSGAIALTTPLVLLSFDRNGYLPEAPFDLGFQLLAGPFSENLPSGALVVAGWASLHPQIKSDGSRSSPGA